jgi:hypothetical protein
MPKGKVHGQGGHGRYSREAQAKFEHGQKIKTQQERAVQTRQRKFSAQIEKAIKGIVAKGEKEIVPTANKAKQKLEEIAKSEGINQEGYVIRMLAIDKFVISEMQKLFKENVIVKDYLDAVDWENYHWLNSRTRTALLTKIIGKNPRIKKQRRILEEIKRQSNKVNALAGGRL